ncbi:toll-like receptor Tollo isoform X2 [Plodia interpunctella]|uniref:toll-like receptor Tollo isoform X2 n=1 Tax=Plodia interpunctella TaxID=58824 RepID=UPI002368A307|nr:toll-like receptor Tollo isoform X2 [Plodia interpunctella]
MTLRLYLFTFLVTTVLTFDRPEKCLTGYMTDVQSWVDADGDLTSYVKQDEAIDLSKKLDPIRTLIMNFENHIINAQKYDIKYLSLAKCKLERVPKIFHFKSLKGELSETLQYLTLYGNNFVDISATGDDYQMSINATQRREVDSVNHFLDDRSIWTLGFENITFANLKELDLRACGIQTIGRHVFKGMRNLQALYLGENCIYEIGNLIICNCHTRELVDAAAINERCQQSELLALNGNGTNEEFNMAVTEYNNRIMDRMNISYLSNSIDNCNKKVDMQKRSKFLLLDYEKEKYSCMQAFESKSIPFIEVKNCLAKSESYGIEQGFQKGVNLLLLLIMPGIVLPVLLVIFMFRRRIRYFFVTMKNSATLSLISNNEVMDDAKIYNYDVFVSYCHEDRAWMLDHLLPHLETDCSVSVCLHERDFQVGLSILENIVSCMDRSRTIMLIISRQFLMSQWCQFEMHLAQHRLLETRREDLTLILLEEIPRRLRPNTLHYLMLTKTYIVWPRAEAEQAVFWRRLNKSVVTQKNKLHDNVTLA